MVSSAALTVDEYLSELPAERRDVVAAVRTMVRRHLSRDITESMNWGMICWEIPLSRYPDTYNGQPLMVAALAAQKNHFGLYMTCGSSDEVRMLAAAFADNGKKYEAGKSCIRFQRVDDLPLAALGSVLASVDIGQFIARHEAGRAASGRRVHGKSAANQAPAKKLATNTSLAKKIPATNAPANKPAAKMIDTRKEIAKKVAVDKAPAKKSPAKRVIGKKAAPTKSPARKRPSPTSARA